MVENVIHACPDGVEMQRIAQHRLGDYFNEVHLLPGPPEDSAVFRLLFHRRSDAGRFWKDLMVRILRSLGQASADATVNLDYRGDEDPVALAG